MVGMLGRPTCTVCGERKKVPVTLPYDIGAEPCQFCNSLTPHREMIDCPNCSEQVKAKPCEKCNKILNMLFKILKEQYGVDVPKIVSDAFCAEG